MCAGLTYGAYKLFSFRENQTISSKDDSLSAAKSFLSKTPEELVNDAFPCRVSKELNVIIHDVTTQNSNAIYCYEHLTHLSVLRSNYIKNQNISSLNAYYKELLEFQTLMEKSMKYVINIQQKIVNLQTFIDLNLKKNILNFGNYELTRYIRPNLNGVDLAIIRPSSVDAEVKGDLLVSLDKKKV